MALAVASVVAAGAVSGFVLVTRGWQAQGERLKVQQHLRIAVDTLSREVRLAGACLPDAGPANIQPLDGTDSGPTDTLTIRANARCAKGSLQNPVNPGASTVRLDTVTGFVAGMQAYLIRGDTTAGEFFVISAVNQAARTLTVDPSTPITGTYPAGTPSSSVYGAEEQTYRIDGSGAVPVLTVTPSRGTLQPIVAGIEQMQIQYVLNRPFAAVGCVGNVDGYCVVALPAGTEWTSVRTVQFDLVARSARRVPGGAGDGFYRLNQTLRLKPRNFVF